jgi:hypothetical protein
MNGNNDHQVCAVAVAIAVSVYSFLPSPLPSFISSSAESVMVRRERCDELSLFCDKMQLFSAIHVFFFNKNLNFIYGTTFSPDFFLNFSNSPKIPEKKFRPFTAATHL